MIRNSCFHAGLNLIEMAGTQAIACSHVGFTLALASYWHVLFQRIINCFILALNYSILNWWSSFWLLLPLSLEVLTMTNSEIHEHGIHNVQVTRIASKFGISPGHHSGIALNRSEGSCGWLNSPDGGTTLQRFHGSDITTMVQITPSDHLKVAVNRLIDENCCHANISSLLQNNNWIIGFWGPCTFRDLFSSACISKKASKPSKHHQN